MVGNIAVFSFLIGAFGDGIICIFGVEHTETVMVFGSEYQISESYFLHKCSPFGWLKTAWLEGFG